MSRLPPGIYTWSPGHVVPSIPWVGDPDETTVPLQPGDQGEEWFVAWQSFPQGGNAVVLWNATVTDLQIRSRELGGNQATIVIPATKVNLALIGSDTGEVDLNGDHLYDIDDAVSWELLVGSTVDGKVRWRFVVRGEVAVDGGLITVTGVGIVGGLTRDRVIGAPTRHNLIGDKHGSFDYGDLRGWFLVAQGNRVACGAGDTVMSATGPAGSITAAVVPGGVDGRYKVALTCTADPGSFREFYLERRYRYPDQPVRPWGRVSIATTAFVQLPIGEDIDSYGLVTTGVESADGTTIYWPLGNDRMGTDPLGGDVDSDMARGAFAREPIEGGAKLPSPPFSNVDVCSRLYPLHATKRVYYDGVQQYQNNLTSTGSPKDLTYHFDALFNHYQSRAVTAQKSPWLVRVEHGALSGIVETGTWHHSDGTSADEANEALCGRGVDLWDKPGPGRRVMAARRRGSRRTNLQINEWDVLASWSINTSAMKTAMRGTSAVSALWGGADEGAINTTSAHGQVIDTIVSGPVGMTPTRFKAWLRHQLDDVRLVQCTGGFVVPWKLAQLFSVGDDIQSFATSGSTLLRGWLHVNAITPQIGAGWALIDFGKVG